MSKNFQISRAFSSKFASKFLIFIAVILACHCSVRVSACLPTVHGCWVGVQACHPCVIQSVGAAATLSNQLPIESLKFDDMQSESSYLSQYNF